MRRRELEKTLQTAGAVASELEFFLIGSQAIHAYCRRPPTEALLSQECDIYPKNQPEIANLLHAEIGPDSSFAQTNGYYADVVTPEIATLPAGWKARLKRFRTGRVTAWCLEANDLMVSKLAAGRLKDLEFVGALLQMRLADAQVVRERISKIPLSERRSVRARLRSVLDDLRHGSK